MQGNGPSLVLEDWFTTQYRRNDVKDKKQNEGLLWASRVHVFARVYSVTIWDIRVRRSLGASLDLAPRDPPYTRRDQIFDLPERVFVRQGSNPNKETRVDPTYKHPPVVSCITPATPPFDCEDEETR